MARVSSRPNLPVERIEIQSERCDVMLLLLQRNKQFSEQSKSARDTQTNIFVTVLSYCLLIIFSPIVTFFVTNLVLSQYIDSVPSNIWAAVSAVVMLHLALGLFVYRAYFSDTTEPTPLARKQD